MVAEVDVAAVAAAQEEGGASRLDGAGGRGRKKTSQRARMARNLARAKARSVSGGRLDTRVPTTG